MRKLEIFFIILFVIVISGVLGIWYYATHTPNGTLEETIKIPCYENLVNPRTGEVIKVPCDEADAWKRQLKLFPNGSPK